MTKDFSATQSGKSATATQDQNPFDSIVALEQQEKERVQKELDVLEREKTDLESSLAKKEAEAEQDLKSKATEELKEHREKEVPTLLKAAETDAQSQQKSLEDTFNSASPALVEELASSVLDHASEIHA